STMWTPQLPPVSGSQSMSIAQTPQQQPTLQQTTLAFKKEEINYLRVNKMTCCTARDMMLEVYRMVAQQAGKPLNESLIEFLNLSAKKSKQKLDQAQRKKLKTDINGDTYDITLLHLSITLLRAHVSPGSVDDNLHQKLAAVKMFRNELVHGSLQISHTDFINKTEQLRNLLTEALLAAKNMNYFDQIVMNHLIMSMNDQLNNTRDKPLTNDDITSYESHNLFQQLKGLLITYGKPELLETYIKWTHLNPVSFIDGADFALNVGIIFTRMVLEEVVPSSHNMQIDYEQIINHVQNTACNLTNVSGIVLIEGQAGVGKTTLLRKILCDWQAGDNTMKGLTNYHLLLFMECRNPHISSLVQLLRSLMPDTAKKYRDEDMVKCALELRLLLLVDGLDELNKSSHELFCELLPLSAMSNITVVCTTRPDMVKDFYKIIPKYLKPVHIKLLGIPDESCTKLATTYHDELIKSGRSQVSTSSLIEYLQRAPRSLQDHLRLPLNLVMLTILWATSPSKVNSVRTTTELYKRIKDMTTEKLLDRLKNNMETQLSKTMDLERRGKYSTVDIPGVLSSIQDVLVKFKVHPSINQDIVDKTNELLLQKNAPSTILSFLEELHQDDPSSLSLRKYQNVLIHLAGIYHLEGAIGDSTAKELVTLLRDSGMTDSRQWVDLLSDVRCDATVTKYIVQYIPEMVTGKIVLEETNIMVYTSLLPHLRPHSLEININSHPEDFTLVYDLMDVMVKYVKCEVDINFEYDFKHPRHCSTKFDKALHCVLQNCQVRKFKGQLSSVNVKTLPQSLVEPYLSVSGNDLELTSALCSLNQRIPSLFRLGIHVPVGVQPSLLPRPLPEAYGKMFLALSGLDAVHLVWAAEVAKQLLPCRKEYWILCFPESNLSDQDLQDLGNQLMVHQVRVFLNTVYVTGADDVTLSYCGYSFLRSRL
ncbi:NACHT, LRR and PYD domains-containing protein 12-like, partial [Homarus americanus]